MFVWLKAKPAKQILGEYDAGFLYACKVALYGGAFNKYPTSNAYQAGEEQAIKMIRLRLNYAGPICDIPHLDFVVKDPERIEELQRLREYSK
jgi:hypothetical protein